MAMTFTLWVKNRESVTEKWRTFTRMAKTSIVLREEALANVLHLVRAGDFLAILRNKKGLGILGAAAREERVESLHCLRASVMLAETYDQMSQYKEAERYLAFDKGAAQALRHVKDITANLLNKSSGATKTEREPTSRLVRALAFFCLQHAIALHRQTDDAFALKKAELLAQEARQCLEKLTRIGFQFDGALSMFFYWTGRFHLLNRSWERAREAFQSSMRHEDDNLRQHLARHAGGLHGTLITTEECAICSKKVSYTNYLLASNMAFGLALVEMEQGTIEKALTLLRPAMIMLDGSTRDRYRKGYVRLLIGQAERVRAGARSAPLQRALRLLEEARAFFTGDSQHDIAHLFYAARALHQLCIASMFMARDQDLTLENRETALLNAVRYFLQGLASFRKEAKTQEGEQYVDHRLEVRLELTKTRLLGAVLKACATWPGASVQDKLQAWLHRLSAVSDLSPAWQEHGRFSAVPANDERILGDLAAELMETMQHAGMTDGNLFGDDSSRSYVLLAEAEAIAAVLQFGGGKIDRERISGFLWRLDVPRESRSDAGTGRANTVAEGWKEAARLAAIARVKELLGRRNLKVRAAAEVAMAQLLLLGSSNGSSSEARKQLLEGWEPIKKQVENQILHDSVSDLRRTLPPLRSVCVIPMEDEIGPRSYKQMQGELQYQVLTNLQSAGLTEPDICKWLKMAPNGIREWKVRDSLSGSRSGTRRKAKATQDSTDTQG